MPRNRNDFARGLFMNLGPIMSNPALEPEPTDEESKSNRATAQKLYDSLVAGYSPKDLIKDKQGNIVGRQDSFFVALPEAYKDPIDQWLDEDRANW